MTHEDWYAIKQRNQKKKKKIQTKPYQTIHNNLSSSFFPRGFVSVHMVQPCNSTDSTTAWKNSCFILSERSDFLAIVNISVVVHTLPMSMLTLFSIDEILLPRYMNCSTNFRSLPFHKQMALSWFSMNTKGNKGIFLKVLINFFST